jgi:Pleckstrin homology domain
MDKNDSRLDLTAPTRHMGQRQLLKEGVLFKAKSGRKLRGFLCSDIIVLTDDTAKTLYRMVRRSVIHSMFPMAAHMVHI